MSSATHTSRASRLKSRQNAEAEYRAIFVLSLPFFLLAVLLARAVRLIRSPIGGTEASGKSLIQEARDSANSTLPYAFMG
ncbi:MAG: hypothetical protein NW217_08950 [Hyphomicrobiaceae bacterium]|nr:hypothetical protein [Hyphomicrobiaceae bacterium]